MGHFELNDHAVFVFILRDNQEIRPALARLGVGFDAIPGIKMGEETQDECMVFSDLYC